MASNLDFTAANVETAIAATAARVATSTNSDMLNICALALVFVVRDGGSIVSLRNSITAKMHDTAKATVSGAMTAAANFVKYQGTDHATFRDMCSEETGAFAGNNAPLTVAKARDMVAAWLVGENGHFTTWRAFAHGYRTMREDKPDDVKAMLAMSAIMARITKEQFSPELLARIAAHCETAGAAKVREARELRESQAHNANTSQDAAAIAEGRKIAAAMKDDGTNKALAA
jgi:hypothetical protein